MKDLHGEERLVRYVEGALSKNENDAVDRHIRNCADCRGFVSFVREFNTRLGEHRPHKTHPIEECPDGSLIFMLEGGILDQESARHVSAHVIFCSRCREEFFLARQLRLQEGGRDSPDAVAEEEHKEVRPERRNRP